MNAAARPLTVAAVDLGASNGRVMLGRVGADTLELVEAHRFPNTPVRVGGTLHWDILSLYRGVLDGLRSAGALAAERTAADGPAPGEGSAGRGGAGHGGAGHGRAGRGGAGRGGAGPGGAGRGGISSIGIDSWAVDYGLLDADGRLLGNPVHYRDERTATAMDAAFARIPADELYARIGVQFQPFNTMFQLMAARADAQTVAARRLLLIPDLIGYWLTSGGLDGRGLDGRGLDGGGLGGGGLGGGALDGGAGAELTNASTTGLLDVRAGRWADDLMDRLELPRELLPELRRPGDPVGALASAVAATTGLAVGTPVTAVASHDTASAVVGVPARGERFAYISCGTWSLVGVELGAPVLTEDSRRANFTNELGVDDTVRFLRNVMGLWLLQESMRAWGMAGDPTDLLRKAASVPGVGRGRDSGGWAVVDAGDPEFLPPGDAPGQLPMPERIERACRRLGQRPPDGPAEIARCIMDSLALAHRTAVAEAQSLSGRPVEVVHLVGGGARNGLLCQLTADACGLPVLAGPVEAGALGNVLIQARALGAVHGGLGELRELVRRTQPVVRYAPRGDQRGWAEAAARLTR